MNFIEKIEESSIKLFIVALTVNLSILDYVLDKFLKENLITFGLSTPYGSILIFLIIVLFLLTYIDGGLAGLLKKIFSFFSN